MFGIENYWGFIAAGILLNIIPGSDSMYIITRSISQGQRAGIYSVLGIISGILIHTLLAALGLSVLLANSPTAFTLVKYIGASYLCYLGFKMLTSKQDALLTASLTENRLTKVLDYQKIYKQGMLTNTLNPKVALYFLAFFPQFDDPSYAHSTLSFLMLGLTFAMTSVIWCLCLALLASRFSQKLRENPTIESVLNKISGVVFIGLGIKLFTERS